MCKVLGVSRSGYYAWVNSRPSKRAVENKNLTERIKVIFKKSKSTYGSPRIHQELRQDYPRVSRPRVARLMKKANIRSITKKKFVVTTDSKHNLPVAENLLNRNFSVERLGEAWVSDITYIRTREGWLYLTAIIDLGDRKIIGWSTGATLKASDTVLPAWNMAIKNRPVVGPLLFHSDRGIQYACSEFKNFVLKNKLVTQSMSRKGNCWDNAVAESFFKTLKTEWVNHHRFVSRKQAQLALFEYIETWYNTRRRHSSLGYLTPSEFGKILMLKKNAA
jgi:transposase InsO family protein